MFFGLIRLRSRLLIIPFWGLTRLRKHHFILFVTYTECFYRGLFHLLGVLLWLSLVSNFWLDVVLSIRNIKNKGALVEIF